MAVAELVLRYLDVLIWPIVVLLVAIVLKGHLPNVLERLKTGEIRAAGVQLKVELADAKSHVASAREESERPEAINQARELVRIEFETFFARLPPEIDGKREPSDRVIWSFVALLQTIGMCAEHLGLKVTTEEANKPGSRGSAMIQFDRMHKTGIIDDEAVKAMGSLNRIYKAAHLSPEIFDSEAAENFSQAAKRLGEVIATNTINHLDM